MVDGTTQSMPSLDVAGHLHINQENGLPVGPVGASPRVSR